MSKTNRREAHFSGCKTMLAAGAAIIALTAAGAANAYEAVVTSPGPLEAGPSSDYPQVAELGPGAPVTVYGCLNGYEWCDVSFQDNRGWFDAQQLAVPYQGQQVPIFDYGVQIGLPVIGFSFNDYWGRYYHNRPFFGERARYVNIPMPAPRAHEGRPGFAPGRGPGPGPHPEMARPGGPGPHPEMARPGGPAPHPENAPHPEPVAHPGAPPHPAPQAARPPEHPPAKPAEHPEAKPAEHPEEHHE
jgi:uncharacterized protein YraI